MQYFPKASINVNNVCLANDRSILMQWNINFLQ
jgi:hypothetical protein